jgi:hypothetical protein
MHDKTLGNDKHICQDRHAEKTYLGIFISHHGWRTLPGRVPFYLQHSLSRPMDDKVFCIVTLGAVFSLQPTIFVIVRELRLQIWR